MASCAIYINLTCRWSAIVYGLTIIVACNIVVVLLIAINVHYVLS